jgi:hypothetical protein
MEPMEFTYLTSSPFSGSTLFAFLANTHPEIATVGEMTGLIRRADPERYECSCGRRIKVCPFWSRVSEEMRIRHQQFDPADFDTKFRIDHPLSRLLHASMPFRGLEILRDTLLKASPAIDRRIHELLARNKALARSILAAAEKRVFFDASKNPEIIRYLHRDPLIRLKVIHLVRDVRGVGYSRQKNKGETNWDTIVRKWIRMNRSIERQLDRMPPDRWIRIRYEDVCQDPTAIMNRFFAFAGVRPFAVPANPQSIEHHIVGNRMRLMTIGDIRVDDAWRSALPAETREFASRTAAQYQTRYGYESS